MLSIKQIDNIDELHPYRKEWDELLQKSGSDTIFSTFDWTATWCRTYSKEGTPFILLITDDEEIIGIAPLAVVSSRLCGLPIKKIKFIGWNYLSYKDFIISQKREESLNLIFSYLKERAYLWDWIELFNIPADSPNFNLLKKACLTLGKLCHIEKGLSCPYVSLNSNWNDYWKDRGRTTRENTLIKIRGLKNKGVFRYRICEDLNTFNKVMRIFFIQHIERWAKNGQISRYKKVKHRNFMLAIGEILLNKKRLRLSFLELNNEILAACYSFKYNRKVYYYSPTFNLEYSKYSPGRVLLYYMIKDAFNENLKEFDFLFGGHSYQFYWTTEIRDNYRIQILQKKPLPRLMYYWLVKIKPKLREIEVLHKIKGTFQRLKILMDTQLLR